MTDPAHTHGFDPGESVESMLSRALAPVEPPPHLYEQLEGKLERVSFAAAEELSEWELIAMRDPRNWVKPAVAVTTGVAAAGALIVLGMRSRKRGEKANEASEAVKALSNAFGDVRREVERSARRIVK